MEVCSRRGVRLESECGCVESSTSIGIVAWRLSLRVTWPVGSFGTNWFGDVAMPLAVMTVEAVKNFRCTGRSSRKTDHVTKHGDSELSRLARKYREPSWRLKMDLAARGYETSYRVH